MVTLYVMGDVIWKVAGSDCGASWLMTENVPVAMPDAVPVGVPFQVAVSVNDCPGCSVSCWTSCALVPEFDIQIALPFAEPHNVLNTLAAIAAARRIGVTPPGSLEVRFSSLRGAVVELEGGVTVVNDCYNANPMSMRAALEHLAATPAERRIAVLGRMAELGPDEARFHREVGTLVDELGIDVLITVGEGALPVAEAFDGQCYAAATPEEARALLDELAQPGDRVLIKGSRSAGLERFLDPVGAQA